MMMTLTVVGSSSQSDLRANKARLMIYYYKQRVSGIVLMEGRRLQRGRIIRFERYGIIFDPAKSGPFYDPQPRRYAMSDIYAFVNAEGDILWQRSSISKQKYAPTNSAHIAVIAGMGRHLRNYTFTPLSVDNYEYVQDLEPGYNFGVQGCYYFIPQFSCGLEYIRHFTRANLYGLQPAGSVPLAGNIEDNISIQSLMLPALFHQPVDRNVHWYAGAGVGAVWYNNRRTWTDGTSDITGATFGCRALTGIDFLFNRNVAVGFQFSFLFATLHNPIVKGDVMEVQGEQTLSRFDLNVSFKYAF